MYVGIANPRWRGKCSWYSRRMRNPRLYVSGKMPIVDGQLALLCRSQNHGWWTGGSTLAPTLSQCFMPRAWFHNPVLTLAPDALRSLLLPLPVYIKAAHVYVYLVDCKCWHGLGALCANDATTTWPAVMCAPPFRRNRDGGTKQIYFLPLFSPFFSHQCTHYLQDISFNFDRCRSILATAMPAKYECNSMDRTGTPLKSDISLT